MSKSWGVLGLLAVISLWSVQVNAQPAPKGLALGVERAFGIANNQQTTEQGDTSTTTGTTEIGLGLGMPTATTSLARVGIDYLLDSGLSIGTGFGVAWLSRDNEPEINNTSVSSEGPSSTLFVFSPRLGYVAQLTESLAFWPRGGLTYATLSSEFETTNIAGMTVTQESSTTEWLLTLEVPLWIMPARNFGFLLAPTFDYGLSHSAESGGVESDAEVSTLAFGLRFGVVGVL
jgi:hypothetical protein